MKGRRALVVDDNQSARAVLGCLLRAWASSSRRRPRTVALEDVFAADVRRPYDLVLLDWRCRG
jgi:CheY-like chemotaxis protein